MSLITMYRGDTLPDITINLNGVDPAGDTIVADLSGASEVLIIASQNRVLLFSRETADRPADGELTLAWEAGDTDDIGVVTVEVQVTWTPDRVLTFRAPDQVNVVRDLR